MFSICLAMALAMENPFDAVSYGQGGCGRVDATQEVPCAGPNFEAHTPLACWLGRNYLHPRVAATVTDAYAEIAPKLPTRRWQYGELGRPQGGRLWPHRTHSNGLSADFFMPVVDIDGHPSTLSTGLLQRFGYGLEFDEQGRLDAASVDWEAIAVHLETLERTGQKYEVTIERIIMTPPFQRLLIQQVPRAARYASRFMKKEAWVRHDEHYHIDFAIPASLRKPLTCK